MSQSDPRYKQNRMQQLRGFFFTARAGSVSAAAKKMYLTQPTVSLQIQALERELEVKLFERRGPKIELTEHGRLLLDLATPLVIGVDQLHQEFQAQRNSVEWGRVIIAAGGSTIQYVLPEYVKKFVHAHPQVELKLDNVTGQEGLARLRAGEVDFAVGPLLDIPRDLKFFPIVAYDPVLITPVDHPLADKKRLTLKDICRYPLILPPRHLSTWRMVELVFSEMQLGYEVALEVGGWEVIKKYVELKMGVSIVMSICIRGNENLAVRPVGQFFPKRTYGIVLRKGKILNRAAMNFIRIMDPDLGIENTETTADSRNPGKGSINSSFPV
jgi:DNA-binding transcriptional LysR family regulator